MGCGTSAHATGVQIMRNREIEAEMLAQAKKEKQKIKLLLLGAGESGKSTVFKQMKVIYGKQFTVAERKQQLPTICSTIIQAAKILADQAYALRLDKEVTAVKSLEAIRSADVYEGIDEVMGNHIRDLWADPGIQMVWQRRHEFQISDSVKYYFNKIDMIKMAHYLPDKDDMIHCRVRTSGIVTEQYVIDGSIFEIYDVGGQRNERKKWIHCFENVTALIFIVSLSEYNQRLYEDSSVNRMEEALTLFDEICNNPYFAKSSVILFLNKRDLFEEKIKTYHIRDTPAFADYTGKDMDYDAGVHYFLTKFLSKNRTSSHQIYHHVTCATDTNNIQLVFDACKDIILRENLLTSGIIDDDD